MTRAHVGAWSEIMRYRIDDGYTLDDKTPERTDRKGNALPVISFSYRPAMPEALYNLRHDAARALSGAAALEIDAAFVVKHLVSWDVTVFDVPTQKDKPAPITVETVKAIGDPYLTYILNTIATWAARPVPPSKETGQETAEKNSSAA